LQVVSHLICALIHLSVADPPLSAQESDRPGCAGDLLLKQLMRAYLREICVCGVPALEQLHP
jgi:hypothetical protein